MNKEIVSDKQAICLIMFFIMGSTLILGTGGEAKQDAWMAVILAIGMAVPMVLVYSRLLSLFHGKDLFEILDAVFGRISGKVISCLYIWYAFHLGSLVLRNFGEFVNTVAMPETPMFITILMIGVLCIWIVTAGIEVISRSSIFFMPLVLFTIFIVQLLVIPQLHFHYLKPVLYNGISPVLKASFSSFSFPFAETVLFTAVFFTLKSKKSLYKAYLYGLLFAGAIVLVLGMRNILVLGPMTQTLYFPSHVAVSRISVGDFIQRIEVTVAIVFVVCAFIKAAVCLFVACKGFSKVFGLRSYRSIVIQTGLLMVYLGYIVYESTMEMRFWAFKVYGYYAFPFQVVLPAITWIAAEIRVRKDKQGVRNATVKS